MMSEETNLTTGRKSTSGNKTWVKKIAREVSEGLEKYSFSEYFASNMTNNYN
jgi:hypothetical protein